jgi:ketosteroid isomerase-like protein
MKTSFYLLACLVLLIGAAGCQATNVESVGDPYMQALAAGDAEAMLVRASDDVVLVIDGGSIFYNELAGKEAMRGYLADMASAGFRLELTGEKVVAGNQITYPDRFALDEFQALGVDWVAGQDILTIEKGRVVRAVWTIDPAAETALHEAILRATVMGWAQSTNDQDLEGCLAMVADDIQRVVIGDPFFHSEVSGKVELAAALKEQQALNMRVEYPDGPAGMRVAGNVVTTPVRFGLDPFRAVGVEWVYGTDEITISDGKISRHVFTINQASAAELGAAFAAQEQGLTPEKLAGVWEYDNPEMGKGYTEYRADGTYEIFRYVAGSPLLWDKGDYTITDDTVTLTTTEAHYCVSGDVGAYTAAIGDDGRLALTVVEDACPRRRPPVEGPVYLSPATP